ncbi:MAG: protein-glutamate O-methyltransferase CheR [Nitrospirae bacterium]|nr:MAG: protein-glutamate O-methyltransferase CheR [Nitrospirota bacterium]
MFEPIKQVELSRDVFRLLRDLIRDYSGIYFNDNSLGLLQRRLCGRLQEHNMNDFRDYYRFLLYNKNREEELSIIMDILTVNETYFFREKNQLDAFSNEILHMLKERNSKTRRIRIFSAGCSTGEEPYTLAMLILESRLFLGWDIEIFGGDINRRVLQAARRGIYRENSFRTTDQYYIDRYFSKQQQGTYRINDNVKKLVNFGYINLLNTDKLLFLGRMDVIFCRNVLIYFDLPSRKKVIDGFYRILNDDGFLLLGHAESLINISTDFELKHLKHDLVYQKPAKGSKRE